MFSRKKEAETAHELRVAVQAGNFDEVQRLIFQNLALPENESNVDYINLKGKYGYTALHWAIDYLAKQRREKNNEETAVKIIALLIERGADSTVLNSKNKTALDLAGDLNCFDVVNEVREQQQRTDQMLKAIKEGDLEKVKELHAQGANLDATNKAGTPLLILAFANKHYLVAEYLITSGADVKKTQANGSTPLHWAANRGHFSLCVRLLEKGADVNAINTDEKATPLHIAVSHQFYKIAQLFIDKGASLEAREKNGRRPEDVADSVELRAMLRDIREGKPVVMSGALPAALHKSHLIASVKTGDLVEVKQLISAGADVNIADDKGDTLLHWAAYRQNEEMCLLLIAHGARLDVKNKFDKTPLEYAKEPMFLLKLKQKMLEAARQAEEKTVQYPEVPVAIESRQYIVKPIEIVTPENDEPVVVLEEKVAPLPVDDTPRIPDDDYADIDASAYLLPVVEQNDQENLVEEEKIGDEPNDELPSSPNSEAPVTPKLLVQEEEINDELVDELPSSPNNDENIDEADVPVMPQENIASPQSEFGPFGLFACVPKMPCGPIEQPENAVAHVVANPAQPAAQSFSILHSFRMFISDAVGEGSNQAQPENAANASQVIS